MGYTVSSEISRVYSTTPISVRLRTKYLQVKWISGNTPWYRLAGWSMFYLPFENISLIYRDVTIVGNKPEN